MSDQECFRVWIDDRIDYGTKWPKVIQDNLDTCSAFIIVMTPRSYDSDWVQNELSRALERDKNIFPLLLEGDTTWLSVQSIQYVDVRQAKLPPSRFYERLAQVIDKKINEDQDEIEPYQLPNGTVISSRYQIVDSLAHGEVFALYKAFDSPLGRDVLIGVNYKPLAEDGDDELRQSTIKYASMEHPNLPTVYDFFMDNTQYCIVLRYEETREFKNIIKVIEGLIV